MEACARADLRLRDRGRCYRMAERAFVCRYEVECLDMSAPRAVYCRGVSAARAGWLGVTSEAINGHRTEFSYFCRTYFHRPAEGLN